MRTLARGVPEAGVWGAAMGHSNTDQRYGPQAMNRRDNRQIGRYVMEAFHIVIFVVSTIFSDQPFLD